MISKWCSLRVLSSHDLFRITTALHWRQTARPSKAARPHKHTLNFRPPHLSRKHSISECWYSTLSFDIHNTTSGLHYCTSQHPHIKTLNYTHKCWVQAIFLSLWTLWFILTTHVIYHWECNPVFLRWQIHSRKWDNGLLLNVSACQYRVCEDRRGTN